MYDLEKKNSARGGTDGGALYASLRYLRLREYKK